MSKQKISNRNGVNVEQKKSVRQFFSLFHDFSYVFSGFDSSAFVVHSFHKQIAWCRRWPESFLFEYLHVHTATSRAINITTLSSSIVGTTVFFTLYLFLLSFQLAPISVLFDSLCLKFQMVLLFFSSYISVHTLRMRVYG